MAPNEHILLHFHIDAAILACVNIVVVQRITGMQVRDIVSFRLRLIGYAILEGFSALQISLLTSCTGKTCSY